MTEALAYFGVLAALSWGVVGTAQALQRGAVVDGEASPLQKLALRLIQQKAFRFDPASWRELFVGFLDQWFGPKLISWKFFWRAAVTSVILNVLLSIEALIPLSLMFIVKFPIYKMIVVFVVFIVISAVSWITSDIVSIAQTRLLLKIKFLPRGKLTILLPIINYMLNNFTIFFIAYAIYVPLLRLVFFNQFSGAVWINFLVSENAFININDRYAPRFHPFGIIAGAVLFVFLRIWCTSYFFVLIYGAPLLILIQRGWLRLRSIGLHFVTPDKPITAIGWSVATVVFSGGAALYPFLF